MLGQVGACTFNSVDSAMPISPAICLLMGRRILDHYLALAGGASRTLLERIQCPCLPTGTIASEAGVAHLVPDRERFVGTRWRRPSSLHVHRYVAALIKMKALAFRRGNVALELETASPGIYARTSQVGRQKGGPSKI